MRRESKTGNGKNRDGGARRPSGRGKSSAAGTGKSGNSAGAAKPRSTGGKAAARPAGGKAAARPAGGRARQEGPSTEVQPPEGLIFGRNSVTELIRSGRPVDKVIVQNGAVGSIGKIVALAKDAGLHIEYADKAVLDKICGSTGHQGIAARTAAHEYADFDELVERLAARNGDALVVLLDGIEDPHNLGAIMRTCECAGADAVVITKNRSCGLNSTVAKTSAGAVEYLPCARVTNMARAVEQLQQAGFWIFAADMDGERVWDRKLSGKLGIVIGNEGSGVSRLVKEKCDFTVSIPMSGRIGSLNASNAAAILIYETVRQRG